MMMERERESVCVCMCMYACVISRSDGTYRRTTKFKSGSSNATCSLFITEYKISPNNSTPSSHVSTKHPHAHTYTKIELILC